MSDLGIAPPHFSQSSQAGLPLRRLLPDAPPHETVPKPEPAPPTEGPAEPDHHATSYPMRLERIDLLSASVLGLLLLAGLGTWMALIRVVVRGL